MTAYRDVWTLIAGIGLVQLGAGILGVIVPLGLGGMGLGAASIGVIGALHAAGFMAGAASAPAALTLFGNIRLFSAAAALTASSALALDLFAHPLAWSVLRVLQGVAFAWIFASIESWLSDAVPARQRGAVTGFYHVIAKAALLAGPFVIIGYQAMDPKVFAWCGFFMALALVPVCITQRAQPEAPDTAPLPLSALFRLAPSAVAGVFLAGVINTGTLALLPLYAQALPAAAGGAAGPATQLAAVAMAVAWAGGLVSQWPAGRLSDLIDRRVVVAIMALLSAAAALPLALALDMLGRPALFACLALWGAGSLSFYGICVAHAVDRAQPRQFPRLMSGLLFVWAVGSVIGPVLSGLAMRSALGPGGLFALAGVLSLALAGAMAYRRSARAEAPAAEQEPWEMAQPTSVVAAEIDPRVETPDAPGPAAPSSVA